LVGTPSSSSSPETELSKWYSDNSFALSVTLSNPANLKVSSWAIVVDLIWDTIFTSNVAVFADGVNPNPVS
jgi:hypothetical protein